MLKTLCMCANIKCNLTIYHVKNFRRRISIDSAHISTDLSSLLLNIMRDFRSGVCKEMIDNARHRINGQLSNTKFLCNIKMTT